MEGGKEKQKMEERNKSEGIRERKKDDGKGRKKEASKKTTNVRCKKGKQEGMRERKNERIMVKEGRRRPASKA